MSRAAAVRLRPFRADDEPGLRRAFADPDVVRWNPPPADGDITGWWTRRNDHASGEHASWAVADTGDDRLLGSVSVFRVDHEGEDAEVGYFVVPGERGRGVARAALAAAARHAFSALRLHRVALLHAVDNPASCRVATAAGFRLEGTLRQSYRYGDGRWHDEHLHARLATD